MCDPAQEQTQNGELAYLTEYVERLQNRVAILESYNETSSSYASVYDLERFQTQFYKTLYVLNTPKNVPYLLQSITFREITRTTIHIPPNTHKFFVTATLACDVNEAIPLYQFAMETSPNASSSMCSRDRPVFTFYPFSAWPLPNNYLLNAPRVVNTTLQSPIIVNDPTKPTEIVFYARHGIEMHWDYRRTGIKRKPDYTIRNIEIVIQVESYP